MVVGIDGSAGCRHALAWALSKEDRLGPVRPVITFMVGPFADGFGTVGGVNPDGQPYRDEAMGMLSDVVSPIDPALVQRAEVVQHRAGPGLVEAAGDAELLVVGSRGRSAFAETLLGSVGSYCVKHAGVPVAIIPDEAEATGPLSRLVVGVDGSPNADAALRWAIEHVEPGGEVVAVEVLSLPASDQSTASRDTAALQTQERCDQVIAETAKRTGTSARVRVVTRVGDPRVELPIASERADLLVVGARGHRAVAHLLLGSVATALTHHPTLATVVVPHH